MPSTEKIHYLRTPWRLLLCLWLAIALLTLAVPIEDAVRRPNGSVFTGYSYESVGDIFFYLNLIEQAKEGNMLFRIMMTPEPHDPALFNPLFLTIGTFARVLHLAPLTTWHAARVVLIGLFLIMLWRVIAALESDNGRARWVLVFVLAAGGVYLRTHETSTLLALSFSPLSVFTLTATLLLWLLWWRALRYGWQLWSVLLVLLLGLLQGVTHPYVLLLWLLVPAVQMFAEVLARRRSVASSLTLIAPMALGVGAGLAAAGIMVAASPTLRAWARGSSIRPWYWSSFLPAFGLLLPVAAWWVVRARRALVRSDAWMFVLLWFAVAFVFSRSPYPYAGRLMLYLPLPLALLAAQGAHHLLLLVCRRPAWLPVAALAGALLVSEHIRHIVVNVTDTFSAPYNEYVDASQRRTFAWIRTQTPPDALLLHAPTWDTIVAQQTYRRVYATNGPLTTDWLEHLGRAFEVYGGWMDERQLRQFLIANRINYMLVLADDTPLSIRTREYCRHLPVEHARCRITFRPAQYQFLERVFQDGTNSVYAVRTR